MADRKDYGYTTVTLNFNLDDPGQRLCYELLNNVPRRKAFFLGLLAKLFVAKYCGGRIPTKEELKGVLQIFPMLINVQGNVTTMQDIDFSNIPMSEKKPRKSAPKKVTKKVAEITAPLETAEDDMEEYPISKETEEISTEIARQMVDTLSMFTLS